MSVIFRFFLTLSSLFLTLGVFLANKGILIFQNSISFLGNVPDLVFFLFYFTFATLVAWVSLMMATYLSDDTITEDSMLQIESANDAFLPSYLGYFFVALSTQDLNVFFFVFGIICLFIFCSRAAYFNPMYFLFGYRFYYGVTSENVKIMLITKNDLKNPKAVCFKNIKRINDFTFIDVGDK